MASLWALCSLLTIAAVVAILAKIIVKMAMSSAWYKKSFAERQNQWSKTGGLFFAPLKQKLFSDLDEHLKQLKGDVLEIGIGAGQNFDDYPQGMSLIAVDYNPHVEKLLKENLAKAGGRVQMKTFIVASSEDMSGAEGKVGVEDNSVAAVVCTKLLCSLSEEQIVKTVQEVKRVLMPGGRFFFMEHVLGKPWSLRYILQQLVSKSHLWPTLFNGCRCDHETLPFIQKGGFKLVQAEKRYLKVTPELHVGSKKISVDWSSRLLAYLVHSVLLGFAEKER